jgi:hypothetical protein
LSQQSAKILLNKLAVAERQLNAAIRMSLANEHPLAIHTVAHAAYGVLRDIKRKRGRSDAFDPYLRGIFYYARDLAEGKTLPEDLTFDPLFPMITSISNRIASGEIRSFHDLASAEVATKGYSGVSLIVRQIF